MDRIDRIAAKLAQDWWARKRHANLSGDDRPADMAEAYAIQARMQSLLTERRGPLAGRKIALSSRAMQEMVGIDHPIAGGFFENDIRQSPAEISVAEFRHPGIEFELAIRIARDCGAHEIHDATSVLDLIATVQPALEVIEDRDADYSDLDVLSLVADNAWCGGVVLGPEIVDWRNHDLADLTGVIEEPRAQDEHTNTGAADPLNSLAWVLNHVAEQQIPVRAGEIIITGSVTRTRFPGPGGQLRYTVAGSTVGLAMN